MGKREAMMMCAECGKGDLEEFIKPEHVEDVGGMRARILDSVRVRRCEACDEEQIMIPDLPGLASAAAAARALSPYAFRPSDLKLMRRALGLKQREFALALDVAPETLSRWEAGAQAVGAVSDKAIRFYVCAQLHERTLVPDDYGKRIVEMQVAALAPGEELPILCFRRVVLKHDRKKEALWDEEMCEAA